VQSLASPDQIVLPLRRESNPATLSQQLMAKLSRDFAAIISMRAVAHERELPLFETIVAIDLYQSLKRMFSLQ
jgi:hypothetical protein